MKKKLVSLIIVFPFSCSFADNDRYFVYTETSVNLSKYKNIKESDIPTLKEGTSTKLYFSENHHQPLVISEEKNYHDRSAGISEVIQTYNHLNEKINSNLDKLKKQEYRSEQYNSQLLNDIDKINDGIDEIHNVNRKQDAKLNAADVKINEINKKISPVLNDISELKQDADNLKTQNASIVLLGDSLQDEIVSVQTVNKEQDNKLEEIYSVNKNITVGLDSLIEKSIGTDAKVHGLDQENEFRKKEITNLDSAIQLTDRVNDEQEDKIQQQGKVLSELKVGSDKLITDLKDVRKKSNMTTNIANANKRDIDKHATKIDKNTLDILKNRQDLRSLENELRETNERLDNGLAASAALNGLFQPYGIGKLNITAAMGGYQSTQALAVGTGYRFNENIAVKTGVAYTGSNDVMYNMAVNLEW